MAEESSKLWLQDSLNRVAVRRVQDVVQGLGKSLPCRVTAVSGALVTVAFEVNASPWALPKIEIPKAESSWVRSPTQVGDLGWTVPADVYLGGVSGIGGGTADLSPPSNFGALVFVPISNAGSPPIDQNAAQVEGPNGAILRTTTGTTSQVVTDQNGTTVTYGSNALTINATEISGVVGSSSLSITGSEIAMTAGGVPIILNSTGLSINGVQFTLHQHSGVTTGTGDTGGVV